MLFMWLMYPLLSMIYFLFLVMLSISCRSLGVISFLERIWLYFLSREIYLFFLASLCECLKERSRGFTVSSDIEKRPSKVLYSSGSCSTMDSRFWFSSSIWSSLFMLEMYLLIWFFNWFLKAGILSSSSLNLYCLAGISAGLYLKDIPL